MRSNILFILLIGAIGVQTITSCTDLPSLKFPSEEEVNRRASSSSVEAVVSSSSSARSSSSAVFSSSSEASSSSTEAAVSSSSSARSSSSALIECNGTEYDPLTQFCYNSSKIGSFCGNNPQKSYNPDLYECKASINPNGIYLKEEITLLTQGKTYNAVLIGEQVWMAENLSTNIVINNGSKCYDDLESKCTTEYGRLYNWETAKDACNSGWHLPSNDEWKALLTAVGGSLSEGKYLNVGTYLKAASGWSSSGNGIDSYGFAALPGGSWGQGNFNNVDYGYWWTSSESNTSNAILWNMYDASNAVISYSYGKSSYWFSVRCVKDN